MKKNPNSENSKTFTHLPNIDLFTLYNTDNMKSELCS